MTDAAGRAIAVYTAGAAQAYINLYNHMPGERVVILGSGNVGLIMARRLTLEGAKVLAVLLSLGGCALISGALDPALFRMKNPPHGCAREMGGAGVVTKSGIMVGAGETLSEEQRSLLQDAIRVSPLPDAWETSLTPALRPFLRQLLNLPLSSYRQAIAQLPCALTRFEFSENGRILVTLPGETQPQIVPPPRSLPTNR